MRLTLFALPLLAALTAPTPTAQRTNAQARVTAHGTCPVSMIAQRRDAGQTMWVVSLEDAAKPKHDEAPRPGSTGLHITLTAPENSPIHQAELAVYFVPPATRALPVYNQYSQYPSKAPKPPAEQKKTFHISATDDASLNLTTDLLVGPASGITRVHILSMDYTNGANWTAPNNSACTVEPNGLLLVGAKP
jgi:hypothetical protein